MFALRVFGSADRRRLVVTRFIWNFHAIARRPGTAGMRHDERGRVLMMTHDDDLTAGALALHRGVMAARAGFNSVASAHFERAVELAPDDPNVWLWLAWMANSPDNTLRCLRRVLDLVPSHPAATAGMAWMKALASDDAKTDSAAAVSTVADLAEVSSPNPALVDVTTCAAGLEVFRATSVDDVAAPRVAFPEFGRQFYSLGFSSRQSRRRLAKL